MVMSNLFSLPAFSSQVNQANELHQWIFTTIHSYIKARVLLVAHDAEFFSSLLLEQAIPFHLCDRDKTNLDRLRNFYKSHDLVRSVQAIDFINPDFQQKYTSIVGVFSTVILLPSFDDVRLTKVFLQNVTRVLAFRGQLILTLPSFTVPYDGLLLSPDELKLLDRAPLKKLLSDFKILKTKYFHWDQ
jgi:hypothetical protein